MNWQSVSRRIPAALAMAAWLSFSSSGVSLAAQAALLTEVSLETAFAPPGFASKQFVKVMEEALRMRLSQTGNFEPSNRKAEVETNKKSSDIKVVGIKCLLSGTVTVGTDYFQTHEMDSERNPKFKKKHKRSSSKSRKRSSKDGGTSATTPGGKSSGSESPPTVLAITIDAQIIDPTTREVISVANTAAKASQVIVLPTEEEMKAENFSDSPFGELTTDAAAQLVTQFNSQAEKIQKKLTHEPTSTQPAASDEPPVIQEQP